LIRPLGFSLDEKHVRRAGLDYWKNVDLTVHDGWTHFVEKELPKYPQRIVFSKSEKLGTKCIFDFDFNINESTMLIMGSEKYGVPPEVADSLLTLDNVSYVYFPMADGIRSYNLANAAAMVRDMLHKI
jgi:tRNA (cytidine/uridine-2'-O-)-methyltransferase